MVKVTILLLNIIAALIAESSSQLIHPTYRPPHGGGGPAIIGPTYRLPSNGGPIFVKPIYRHPIKYPTFRVAREAPNDEPLWLYKGDDIPRAPTSSDHPYLPSIIDDIKLDPNRRIARSVDEPLWLYQGDDVPRAPASSDHPYLPSIIDDIKLDPNRRTARSVDSPSARRHGGHSRPSGSRNTGPTHPGYNRRNTREIHLPTFYDPLRPSPIPKPYDPFNPRPRVPPLQPYPIYTRVARDVQIPGMRKPSHRDVIIPNWNPNARIKPWQTIGVRPRRPRKADDFIHNQEIIQIEA